jgi:hypothetical protein
MLEKFDGCSENEDRKISSESTVGRFSGSYIECDLIEHQKLFAFRDQHRTLQFSRRKSCFFS